MCTRPCIGIYNDGNVTVNVSLVLMYETKKIFLGLIYIYFFDTSNQEHSHTMVPDQALITLEGEVTRPTVESDEPILAAAGTNSQLLRRDGERSWWNQLRRSAHYQILKRFVIGV